MYDNTFINSPSRRVVALASFVVAFIASSFSTRPPSRREVALASFVVAFNCELVFPRIHAMCARWRVDPNIPKHLSDRPRPVLATHRRS